MSSIYWAYVLYPDINQVYVRYMSIIPGGWCCGGGHGPIPPEPPAIRSPGLVMTLIFFTIGATASFTLAHVAVDSAFRGQHLLGPGP